MTDDPTDPIANLAALVEAYVLARRAADERHGTIVSAPAGWTVASFEGDAIIYSAVIAFLIGPDGSLRQAVTAESCALKYSALVDPASLRYVSVGNGKVFANESDWLAEMRALRQFLSEPEAPAEMMAH